MSVIKKDCVCSLMVPVDVEPWSRSTMEPCRRSAIQMFRCHRLQPITANYSLVCVHGSRCGSRGRSSRLLLFKKS